MAGIATTRLPPEVRRLIERHSLEVGPDESWQKQRQVTFDGRRAVYFPNVGIAQVFPAGRTSTLPHARVQAPACWLNVGGPLTGSAAMAFEKILDPDYRPRGQEESTFAVQSDGAEITVTRRYPEAVGIAHVVTVSLDSGGGVSRYRTENLTDRRLALYKGELEWERVGESAGETTHAARSLRVTMATSNEALEGADWLVRVEYSGAKPTPGRPPYTLADLGMEKGTRVRGVDERGRSTRYVVGAAPTPKPKSAPRVTEEALLKQAELLRSRGFAKPEGEGS